MSFVGKFGRKVLVPALQGLMGRRNLVRFSRLLTMESRLDGANVFSTNGEFMLQNLVLEVLFPKDEVVVFDVGANQGEWTTNLLNHPQSSRIHVHVFEPASTTYRFLAQNLGVGRRNITLVNQALSNTVGRASFYVMGEGAGTNSLHTTGERSESCEQVILNTVDDYCRQGAISRLHFLKIDAEGHDLLVLKGAQVMLREHNISVLQFEYNQRWISSRHLLKDAFELLKPLGYALGKITAKGIEFYPEWHFELESYREGNYLACLTELVPKFPQVKWWYLE